MANLTNIAIAAPLLLLALVGLRIVDRVLRTRERTAARATLGRRDQLARLHRYAPIHPNEATAPRPSAVPVGVGRAAFLDAEGLRDGSAAAADQRAA